ncbi:Protein SRG1 [Linum perenne]
MDSELAKLHSACKDWGFFQLVNHVVCSTVVDNMKKQVEEFFNLPMEIKKKFWQSPGELEGFGQAFVVSEEQKLDWADVFFLVTQPPNLRKPHLLPHLPLPFRKSTHPNGESPADEARGNEGHLLRKHKANNENQLLSSMPTTKQSHRINSSF